VPSLESDAWRFARAASLAQRAARQYPPLEKRPASAAREAEDLLLQVEGLKKYFPATKSARVRVDGIGFPWRKARRCAGGRIRLRQVDGKKTILRLLRPDAG
jgi:hypothetical protein